MSRLCMKGVLQPHFMHRSSFRLQHPHLPLMTSKYKNLPGIGGWQPFEDGSQALVVVEDEAVVKDERQPVCIALDKVGGGEAQRQIDLVAVPLLTCSSGISFRRVFKNAFKFSSMLMLE